MMLKTENLNTFYGKVHVLRDVCIEVEEHEIVCILGPNGAGKSTLLRTLAGLMHPKGGRINFKQMNITELSAEKIVIYGMSLVPEGGSVFTNLPVIDNLILGIYSQQKKLSKEEKTIRLNNVFDLFPILKERETQKAGTLSGGEQRMLAIGRSLMSKPEMLLLDEPSLGLAPLVVKDIFQALQDINKEGTTILLVEQNAKATLEVADRGYLMLLGKVMLSDTSDNLLKREDITTLYLGKKRQFSNK